MLNAGSTISQVMNCGGLREAGLDFRPNDNLISRDAASTIPARTSRTRFDPLSSVATVLPGNRRGYRVDFDPAIGPKVYQMVYPSKNPDADRRGLPRVTILVNTRNGLVSPGEVTERPKVRHWKCRVLSQVPRVRIPPSPLVSCLYETG